MTFGNPHLYLGLYSRDFPAYSHLALHTHIPYKQCELRSIIITITVLQEKCTFSALSWLPWERFSWKFMSGTSLEEQCVTAHVSRPLYEGFSSKAVICPSVYIRSKSCDFAGKWSVMKGTLLEQQSTFWTVPWLPLEGFSWKFVSVNPRIFATNNVSLVVIGG